MSDRYEIINSINEAKVLNAIKNGYLAVSEIQKVISMCHTTVGKILFRLLKRGDIEKVRANKQGGLYHYHFIADSMLRIPEHLNAEVPPPKRDLRPLNNTTARVYTTEHIDQLIKQHPKPSSKRKWGNYGISGSTLGGAYYDY